MSVHSLYDKYGEATAARYTDMFAPFVFDTPNLQPYFGKMPREQWRPLHVDYICAMWGKPNLPQARQALRAIIATHMPVNPPDFIWGRVTLYARQWLFEVGLDEPDVEFTMARWILEQPLFVLP